MTFVIDASVAVSWMFNDEDHPLSMAALDRLNREPAVAPALWWFEVRHVLLTAEKRRRIATAEVSGLLRDLAVLPIALDHELNEVQLMDIARRHGLTAYDAAYLELAIRRAAPLATLDGRLARAAAAEGLSPF